MSGILYLVATPIGNLGDMTYRGVEILKVADLIACEDKRVSMRLLAHYGIQKRLVTYNDINKFKAAPGLIRELKTGTQVALITDAGTPGISDPGFHLVNLALTEGIAVLPIPGPSALCAAIGPAGLPAHAFVFEGFLPPKGSKRRKRL